MDDSTKTASDNDVSSLEEPTTIVRPVGSSAPKPAARQPEQPAKRRVLRALLSRVNLYLLAFVLLLVIAGVTGGTFYLKSQSNGPGSNVPPQSLSQSALDQLSNSDVSVGEPKHTLSVQSNAIFSGDVLVRSNLQIAGTLQVGTNLAINGVRVTGNSTFDDVQITKSLAVTGNGSLQGQLNVQQSLSVNGTGTFLGAVSAPSLTVTTLQLNGNLNLTHHIAAGGSTPSRSNGPALGSGGTVSVSGSDSAGSITINTGSSPAAGCYVTVTFATPFSSTPHISITPVGSAAATVGYYINRSTSSFSVCSVNAAPGSSTFGFDYIAFD